jgi:hypothetical protein
MSAAPAARALAALVLLATAPLAAGEEGRTTAGTGDAQSPEEGLRGRVDLRAGVVSFDYAETYQGRLLDHEQGFLPAIDAEAEVRWRWAFGRLALRLAGGSLDYGGEAQSSSPAVDGVWYHTTSDATQLEGRVELGGHVDARGRVALFLGVGARSWRRTIHDGMAVGRDGISYLIQGYAETYHWGELEAGARYVLLDRREDVWDVDARLVQTFSPGLDVDFLGSPISLALGARLGWRAATTFRHALAPQAFGVATLWGEGYGFGASAVDPVHNVLEPDSRTYRFGLEVGVGLQ